MICFFTTVETRRVTLHFSRSHLRSLTKNIEMVIRWWTWNSHPAHSTSPEGCATSADGVTPKKGPIRRHMCFRWKVKFNCLDQVWPTGHFWPAMVFQMALGGFLWLCIKNWYTCRSWLSISSKSVTIAEFFALEGFFSYILPHWVFLI